MSCVVNKRIKATWCHYIKKEGWVRKSPNFVDAICEWFLGWSELNCLFVSDSECQFTTSTTHGRGHQWSSIRFYSLKSLPLKPNSLQIRRHKHKVSDKKVLFFNTLDWLRQVCRDHCPTPFSYSVWQKEYFHLFPLTVGIWSPLIFIVFMFICLVSSY